MSSLSHAISDPATGSRNILYHELNPFFEQLARFPSSRALRASTLYARLRPEIERVLASVAQEDFAAGLPRHANEVSPAIRATAWNIERGIRLRAIIRTLQKHPVLHESDILLLTELDYGMARSANRFVAREIAEALKMNYVFAPCYIALNKGNGKEAAVPGDNVESLHGNALLSRYPLRRAHSIALPNGKDKMRGVEKRLGCQRAVVADVEHPLGTFRAVSLHLDAHSTQRHRHRQLKIVLDHLEGLRPTLPVLIGGDWNTSTYNSKRAAYSIAGYCRRVLMGVRHVVENHYPHPDRWFERHLFGELEKRGFIYRELNERGACTLHYNVKDRAVNVHLADWIPGWCFPFINWALKREEGRCSLKLDWFAGKGISVPEAAHPPKVISDFNDSDGLLSDHDPIVLDFVPQR